MTMTMMMKNIFSVKINVQCYEYIICVAINKSMLGKKT